MKVPFSTVRLSLALVLFATLASVASSPPPGSTTLTPAAWGFFSDGGGLPIDGVPDFSETGFRVVVGYSSTTPELFRGIYEFNLSEIAFTTVNASLRLQVSEIYSGFVPPETITIQLHGYPGDGAVSASDFSAGSLLSSFAMASAQALDVDVSAFVSSALQSGNSFVGFNLRPVGDPIVNQTAVILGTPAYGPASSTLTVSPVPEPSTVGLAGLGGMLLMRRWRSRAKMAEATPLQIHRARGWWDRSLFSKWFV